METTDRTDPLAAIGLLLEPVRRALYDYVCAREREVSRNEAAEAVGIQRNLAAFHLDKLVEAGLLAATFRRLGERRGPGAGRPAKLYRRVPGEVAVSIPARDYQAIAYLLAETVERTGTDAELYETARRAGERAGREAATAAEAAAEAGPVDVERVLAARGYEPFREGQALLLRNCPFGSVMRAFPLMVCGMNTALIEGLLRGLGSDYVATMDPAPGRCCVVITERQDPEANQG